MNQDAIMSLITLVSMLGGMGIGALVFENCNNRGLSGGKTIAAVGLAGLIWAGFILIISIGLTA